MVALPFARQRLQQAATNLASDFTSEIVLAIEDLDGMASTRLGHALHLAASSFNSLSEKRRKRVVNTSWGFTEELVCMLNKVYTPCLGAPFKGNVERTMSAFFGHKQCFEQVKFDQAQGSGHLGRGGSRHLQGSWVPQNKSYKQVWSENRGNKRNGSWSWWNQPPSKFPEPGPHKHP